MVLKDRLSKLGDDIIITCLGTFVKLEKLDLKLNNLTSVQPKYILYSAQKKLREVEDGGDDFDWNTDDELEIENYNSSSSCLTLPNGDAGEASSSAVLANSKVLDHFVNMGFSREMVSKVIQEYGEENEDKLLEELLSYKVS
ncbi:DNA (cytosine-5)-methyltransferase DRM1-like [Glycine soja]|uniref:DNA (cytosine-5)-methyltransferase DRM1-like n=1 Tax=Glycine soja TaxID=3848 RepID=UPI00103A03F7|nr:DNA (cytosine-5)-methyltransferase DRM1-like [Glycine soja]XP_028193259.1 DNA (cytosine-5)-methyltransferase DRM1-like [Glycine soja]